MRGRYTKSIHPNMTELLFVYGTLRDPEVQRKIIGRELVGEPDTLEDYTTVQIALEDGVYPILVKTPRENVRGLVLKVLPTDFSALDEYEGDAYQRVRIQLKSGQEAWVYEGKE